MFDDLLHGEIELPRQDVYLRVDFPPVRPVEGNPEIDGLLLHLFGLRYIEVEICHNITN